MAPGDFPRRHRGSLVSLPDGMNCLSRLECPPDTASEALSEPSRFFEVQIKGGLGTRTAASSARTLNARSRLLARARDRDAQSIFSPSSENRNSIKCNIKFLTLALHPYFTRGEKRRNSGENSNSRSLVHARTRSYTGVRAACDGRVREQIFANRLRPVCSRQFARRRTVCHDANPGSSVRRRGA